MKKFTPLGKGIATFVTRAAVGAAVVTASLPASAATAFFNAKVTLIAGFGQENGGAPGLFINADNGTAIQVVTSTTVLAPCAGHAQTSDSIKTMISLAQAAMLSGKKVHLYYNSCNQGFPQPTKFLVRVDLVN